MSIYVKVWKDKLTYLEGWTIATTHAPYSTGNNARVGIENGVNQNVEDRAKLT